MNAWINQMAEATGIGRFGLDFSLSDVSLLVPDARLLWIAIVAGCQEAWSNDHRDRKSDAHRK